MQNSTVFEGRLTKDPVLKTVGEKSVVNFTIAVARDYNKNEADFISCVVWGKQAESLSKYKHQGDLISVSGPLRSRSYTDQNSNRQTILEVNVKKLTFLGNSRRNVENDARNEVSEYNIVNESSLNEISDEKTFDFGSNPNNDFFENPIANCNW